MSRSSILTTTWAVFMGCSTAKRLSAELGITQNAAQLRLGKAKRAGLLGKDGHYRFFVPMDIQEGLE